MLPDADPIIQNYENSVARMILYLVGESRVPLGVKMAVGVMRGNRSTLVLENGLYRLTMFGILPLLAPEYLKEVIARLLARGLLAMGPISNTQNYEYLKVTPEGRDFLADMNRRIDFPFAEELASRDVIELDPVEQVLYGDMLGLRRKLAAQRKVGPHSVCDHYILREMTRAKPLTLEALRALPGVSQKFVEESGESFLALIREHAKR